MPLTYRIDAELMLVLTTGTGVLDDDDVLAHKEALVADPTFVAGMRELSDLRAVQDVRITSQGVRMMVGLDEAHAQSFGACKLAIIAAQDSTFGMSRMYQQLADPVRSNIGVFKDYAPAILWLGVDPIDE